MDHKGQMDVNPFVRDLGLVVHYIRVYRGEYKRDMISMKKAKKEAD